MTTPIHAVRSGCESQRLQALYVLLGPFEEGRTVIVERFRYPLAMLGILFVMRPCGPAAAQTPPPSMCPQIAATIDEVIDSSRSVSTDIFHFTTTEALSEPAIAAGPPGIGTVVLSQHALASSEPGVLAIEAHYLRMEDRTHLPVSIVPTATPLVRGGRNTLGIITAVLYVGIATLVYNALNYGKYATLPKGTKIEIVVGDAALERGCRARLAGARHTP